MDNSKKILIIQSYNPNKGDNSVVGVMLSSLRKHGYEISMTAFDPVKAQKDFQIEAFDYLISFRKMKLTSQKCMFLKYAFQELSWSLYVFLWVGLYQLKIRFPLPKGKRKMIDAYLNADLVVLPGGHFFTSFNSLVNNFTHYCGLRFAQLIGKKTMVYSHTVGPYKDNFVGKLERRMGNRVLKKTDLVTLRESDSLRNYSGENVKVTAETVFIEPVLWGETDISKYIPQYAGETVVGITIHHIYYKHYFNKEHYVDLMVGIFDAILAKYDCCLLMIPMEDNYKAGGDRPIIKEMMLKVNTKYRERINMVTDDLSSTATANVISRCDLFVGTKTHSIVYGLKTATPTLSISYQEKSTEFMKMFGMEENAIPMENLNQADFMSIFDRIYYNRKEIKQTLQKIYPLVKEKAENNNVLLKSLINV